MRTTIWANLSERESVAVWQWLRNGGLVTDVELTADDVLFSYGHEAHQAVLNAHIALGIGLPSDETTILPGPEPETERKMAVVLPWWLDWRRWFQPPVRLGIGA